MKKQSGFTLIELVATTVILGVLSAVAIPKFMDLNGKATQAAVKGVADTLTTAANANYASRVITVDATNMQTVGTGLTCFSVAPKLLTTELLPSGYSAIETDNLVLGNNLCTLSIGVGTQKKIATFGIIGIE